MTKSIRGRRGFDLVGALSNASVSLARSPEGSFFVVATTVVVMVVQRLFSSSCSQREGERDSLLGWQSIHQVGMYTRCNNIH